MDTALLIEADRYLRKPYAQPSPERSAPTDPDGATPLRAIFLPLRRELQLVVVAFPRPVQAEELALGGIKFGCAPRQQ